MSEEESIPKTDHPDVEDPRERLRTWVHAVDMRVAMASTMMPGKPTVALGILLISEDGGEGQVTAQFEGEPFLKDIREICETDNLWEPGPPPLYLYLVEYNDGTPRELIVALDVEEARELAEDNHEADSITSVRCIGKAGVGNDLDDEPVMPLEHGRLMTEPTE